MMFVLDSVYSWQKFPVTGPRSPGVYDISRPLFLTVALITLGQTADSGCGWLGFQCTAEDLAAIRLLNGRKGSAGDPNTHESPIPNAKHPFLSSCV